MKILFPTDFSDASLNAFAYAIEFAKQLDAEIVTIGTYQVHHPVYNEDPSYPDTAELIEFEDFNEELSKLRQMLEMRNGTHLKISHRLESASVITGILHGTDEECPDLILMGTSQVTNSIFPLKRSRTQQVVSKSFVPILAVPENFHYRPLRRIVYLTHLRKRKFCSLEKIIHLTGFAQPELLVVELDPEIAEAHEADVARWRKHFMGLTIHFKVVHKSATPATIQKLGNEFDADLLVFDSHPKKQGTFSLSFGLATKVGMQSDIPLLYVPSDF